MRRTGGRDISIKSFTKPGLDTKKIKDGGGELVLGRPIHRGYYVPFQNSERSNAESSTLNAVLLDLGNTMAKGIQGVSLSSLIDVLDVN